MLICIGDGIRDSLFQTLVLQYLSLCNSSIYQNIAITERNIHCHEGILSLQLVKYKRKGYIPPMVSVL